MHLTTEEPSGQAPDQWKDFTRWVQERIAQTTAEKQGQYSFRKLFLPKRMVSLFEDEALAPSKPAPWESRVAVGGTAPLGAGGPAAAPKIDKGALVYSAISHHGTTGLRPTSISRVEVYPYSIKFCRPIRDRKQSDITRKVKRGLIDGFSVKSRTRLQRVASESRDTLISQFGMTYHNNVPDGKDAKMHLDRFMTWLRRQIKDLKYLWVHEFQSRGAAHYHLFLNTPPDRDLQLEMAKKWVEITDGTQEQENLHSSEDNWIDWDMGSGSYVAKYLGKHAQKVVPEGYGWVGRWWGSSRGLMPKPTVYSASDLRSMLCEEITSIKMRSLVDKLIRTLGNALKARHRRYNVKRKHLSQKKCSFWVQDGTDLFWHFISYENDLLKQEYEYEIDRFGYDSP